MQSPSCWNNLHKHSITISSKLGLSSLCLRIICFLISFRFRFQDARKWPSLFCAAAEDSPRARSRARARAEGQENLVPTPTRPLCFRSEGGGYDQTDMWRWRLKAIMHGWQTTLLALPTRAFCHRSKVFTCRHSYPLDNGLSFRPFRCRAL